jgi:multiple sugar transport system permease protein
MITNISTEKRKKYIFIASIIIPIFMLFFVIRIWPIIDSIKLSLFKYDMLTDTGKFVGLDNFRKLFLSKDFKISLKNTLLFVVLTVPANIVIGLGLAMLLESKKKKHPILEAIYFLPYMIPIVPASIIWKWIYSPNGLLNRLLDLFNLPGVGWLTSRYALYSIMVLFVWRMNGYLMIIFLVGLRSIPSVYKDAALVDGANVWQQFRHVILPILKPIILYASVMATVWAFMIFSPVYVMSQGSDFAPGGSVKVLSLDLYMRAFNYLKLDMACAEAVVLFLIIILVTFINLRMNKTESLY